MHLRKAKVKGRVYLSIVQSYRTPDGKTRSKTIETIGYADAFEGIYGDPIAHFEAEVERRNAEARTAGAAITVKFSPAKKIDKRAEGRVELGAAVPSAYFHRDLGVWGFFEKKRTARGFAYDPCRILELLVWNRISDPGSKRAAFEARGRFPRRCDFSLDDVYRSLTYLNANADALVRHMNESLEAARGPRNRARLYYDVTNYYFEVENEDIDGLRRRGVSKEHRPSPIVQMGLFLDGDGLPLDYEIFPGNRNDMSTMLPAMEKAGLRRAGGPEAGRVIVVADKGLNTSGNIAAVTLDGNGFILSQSVRRATRELRGWVLSGEGYERNASGTFKVKSRVADKAVHVVGEDGRRRKVTVPVKEVAFWSRDYFERSRREREKVVERSRAAIEGGEMSSAAAKTPVRYAKDMPVVRETGEAASHNWVLDEARIAADEACDGYYCIVTSEQEMGDREVIEAYRGLWRIEDSFRVLKSDLDARPVYVSREDHIRAHFLVCYVALLVMRLMQLDTGREHTSEQIAEALRGVVGHRLDANAYLFDYRTDLTDELAAAVGIDLSRQVLTRGQIRQVMADVRKPRAEVEVSRR
ncbi:MAG: IS1634 family transposase [Parafannyhessea sp.]|uniref:IS1634 family transposase n=1 Tax=Parafannyhessea sp. TaxID=2847324 RepID=UPI003F0E999F